MLEGTAEYANLKNLEKVLLYDTVRVKDERIGMDTEVEVTELEYDIVAMGPSHGRTGDLGGPPGVMTGS